MATMIPSDIGEFETEGERAFYEFLEEVAKPDAHYLCWYLPEVNGKEPDFLLYSDEVGLIIFEVKDWALRQIEEATPHHFLFQIKGKTESRKNPFQQAHLARQLHERVRRFLGKDFRDVNKNVGSGLKYCKRI